MNKAVFLDRDGVLIEDMKYNCDINKIYINTNLVEILKILQKEFMLIIITNQSGIARGFFKMSDVKKFNNALLCRLKALDVKIDDVFICPHYIDGKIKKYSINCECRKPKTGLIMAAQKKYDICLNQSFLIGDKQSDILCGKNAGLKECFNMSEISTNLILKKIKS